MSTEETTETVSPTLLQEPIVDDNGAHVTTNYDNYNDKGLCANKTLPGGEPNLLDAAVEEKAVADILVALTVEERAQIPHPDKPLRHFRASKGDLTRAIESVKSTLQWREEFGVDAIVNCLEPNGDQELAAIIRAENATGKIYSRGYDSTGRVLMYMRPARENTNIEIDNMRHLVWQMEKAIACTRRKSRELGQERTKINLMIDYAGFKLRDTPPMSTTKYTLKILQDMYPEILFCAYVLNPPMVFRTFWMIVKPFIDTVTKEKIVFCSGKSGMAKLHAKVTEHDKLEQAAGGTVDVKEFNSKEYLELSFGTSFDE